MKILIMVIIALAISTGSWASTRCENSLDKSGINLLSFNNINVLRPMLVVNQYQSMKPLLKETIDERRGCCSHHSGVCGCSDGRAVCCDNTLSPSCGCD